MHLPVQIYFAYCYPYTYSNLLSYLNELGQVLGAPPLVPHFRPEGTWNQFCLFSSC